MARASLMVCAASCTLMNPALRVLYGQTGDAGRMRSRARLASSQLRIGVEAMHPGQPAEARPGGTSAKLAAGEVNGPAEAGCPLGVADAEPVPATMPVMVMAVTSASTWMRLMRDSSSVGLRFAGDETGSIAAPGLKKLGLRALGGK
jgi:hypothetical protein